MKIIDPNRAKYTRKIGKFKICEFCNPRNIEEQECKSLSGKYWMVLVNKFPYMDGNLMVIPKRHVKNIEGLEKEEWIEFHEVLKNTKKKLGEVFKTKDFNIGLNIGKGAGASIDHMHWQIIPRNKKSLQNSLNIFAGLHVIAVSPDELKRRIEKK